MTEIVDGRLAAGDLRLADGNGGWRLADGNLLSLRYTPMRDASRKRCFPGSLLFPALLAALPAAAGEPVVRTGLEALAADGFAALQGRKVGLITNQSGTDRRLRPAAEVLALGKVQLVALFAPEHGIRGAADAGA